MRPSDLRVLADGLIHQAEMLKRDHPAARHLRDAAASLLDADREIEQRPEGVFTPPA